MDPFENYATGLESSARDAFAITPHDDNDLEVYPRALLIGVAGDLEVIMLDGSTPVVLPVPAGYNPLRVKRVLDTNTTATGIVGLV